MSLILSIAVITMNRAEQLKEALKSCLACELPKETEFVIIDNASTDNTEEVVKEILDNCGYPFYYEKMPENIGAGAGRNYAYRISKGTIVYGLDDDAVIDIENNKLFFIRALKVFEENKNVATIGTQIYDIAWGRNRIEKHPKEICDKVYLCKMFSGGSHFLRKEVFPFQPYMPNKYGYEELPPCLIALDKGYINVFCSDIRVVHKPKVNKWDYTNERNHELLAKECAIPYAIKKMMYPIIFRPILYFGYKKRCKKHLGKIKGLKKRANQFVKETIRNYKIDYKIKAKTVIKMYKDFGISVF